MASKGQLTGMRGVYLVAAELAGRGFVASPTSRSANSADLLVSDQRCKRPFTVQVKTNAKSATWWLVNKDTHRIKSDTFLYVLVNLRGDGPHDYYVMPSATVAGNARTFKRPNSTFYGLSRKAANRYKDDWSRFGRP